MLRDLRQDALVHRRGRLTGADVSAACVAVRLAIAVFEGRYFVLVLWAIEKVLHEMNGVIEVPGIHISDRNVQLAHELRT